MRQLEKRVIARQVRDSKTQSDVAIFALHTETAYQVLQTWQLSLGGFADWNLHVRDALRRIFCAFFMSQVARVTMVRETARNLRPRAHAVLFYCSGVSAVYRARNRGGYLFNCTRLSTRYELRNFMGNALAFSKLRVR